MQRAFQKDLQDRPEYWARARAEAAELAKARKTLDRMMAIEAGLIAPPWVDKLIGQLKSKTRKGRLSPTEIVAHEIFPPRVAPPTVSTPDAVKMLCDELIRRNIKIRSPDTLKRAIGRRPK